MLFVDEHERPLIRRETDPELTVGAVGVGAFVGAATERPGLVGVDLDRQRVVTHDQLPVGLEGTEPSGVRAANDAFAVMAFELPVRAPHLACLQGVQDVGHEQVDVFLGTQGRDDGQQQQQRDPGQSAHRFLFIGSHYAASGGITPPRARPPVAILSSILGELPRLPCFAVESRYTGGSSCRNDSGWS